MKEILRKSFLLLDPAQKKKGSVIICLLVFQSVLDFFSIASFLPLIFLIINPGFITSNKILASAYSYFSFSSSTNFIVAISILVLLFTVVKAIVGYGINRAKAAFAFRVSAELCGRAMEYYLASGYLHFSETDFSREVTRINSHPITFANSVLIPIANLISESLLFGLITACVILYDVKIILLLLVTLLPFIVLYRIFKHNTKRYSTIIKDRYPLYLKYAQQLIEALIEVKVAAKEHFFSKRHAQTARDLSQAFATDHVIQHSLVRLTEIIAAFVICILVIYTVLTGQTYQQSILILSVYAGASFRIIPSINRILLASFQIRSHEYIVDELSHLIDTSKLQGTSSSEKIVFSDELKLSDVSFGYPGQPSVLQNVNMTIRKGTKTALTGKSGEGKTTLLLILLGFLKDYTGTLQVDNNVVTGDTIRSIVGYVPQNPYILDGTLAENIAFGVPAENIDRDKVHALLQELDLENLVQRLPAGIDSNIGEKGVKLSGGQRQRITLARALYSNADILLIDEATNQIHHSLEVDILKQLDTLKRKGKTIIMITHKLSKDSTYDAVYKLDRGNLTEAIASSEFN